MLLLLSFLSAAGLLLPPVPFYDACREQEHA